jgi:RHS repeat-associated protein
MTVPIAVSPGRSGSGPQLSLSYDSGNGNGPFGFGWSLSLPSITRKTDKGLPQYNDAEESDTILLSGTEDLVPVLNDDGTRWSDTRSIDGVEYRIHRYRPRVEGLFARIERWTRRGAGDVHWRSISRDNTLTIYGKDPNSRIADPADPGRVFTWLICETRDDRGNAVIYRYKEEDGAGVRLTQAHERNRGARADPRRTANRYLKRILYGNRVPLLDESGHRPHFLAGTRTQDAGWMFELVLDYGEHDAAAPRPDDAGEWLFRDDPFSSYRSGFEVRTTRLCRRALMFHHFPEEEGVGMSCLVRSTDFTYADQQDLDQVHNPSYTFLRSVTQRGYKRHNGGYLQRSLPPVEFAYSQPSVQDRVEEVDAASLENLPIGLDGAAYQWTDLHGEGIPGILTEQGGAWFYKRNLSPLNEKAGSDGVRAEARFAPVEVVATRPNLTLTSGEAQFMDLAGDGQPDLVVLGGPTPGLYEHDGDQSWQPFRPFISPLNRDTRDPNLRFVDLDGDGHADVLITEAEAFVWHPSLKEAGFGPARRVAQPPDAEKGPRLVFADGTQSIYLADMSGDGLTDLARIRNGEVCYWPNLGYGRFGARVTMDRAPHFDRPDQFDQKRVRLADIDGTGTADIIYLHRDGVRLYFNQSGNSWSEAQILSVFPPADDLAAVTAVDLLGNGTACLVWSSPLPHATGRQMRYVNLMGGQKPHLLIGTANNLGAETHIHYAPATRFYLQDKVTGTPWITRLPFPVYVVEKIETYDHISRNRFVTRYRYHHGYFDGEEREFRGFGMVEQWDTEEFVALTERGAFPAGDNVEPASHVPPVYTRTWFHSGAFLDRDHISRQFEREYYREPGQTETQFLEQLLPDTSLPFGLDIEEEREACRALKGSLLRQEVYALDGTEKEPHPYTVSERDYTLKRLQPRGENHHAVFCSHPREVITYHYERNPDDPRIEHALTLEVDAFGNVLKAAAIGYGRRPPGPSLLDAADRDRQTQTLVTYIEDRYTNAVATEQAYRTPRPCETRTYELTGYESSGPAGRFQAADLVQPDPDQPDHLVHIFDREIAYEAQPAGERERRLIEQVRRLYRPDDLGVSQHDPLALLPLGTAESLALTGESYRLAFTPGLLARVFQRDDQPLLPNPADLLGGTGADQGGYVDLDGDGHWWLPAGRTLLSPGSNDTADQELAYARRHFFLPQRYRGPFHTDAISTERTVTYDAYDLLMLETRDALDNRVSAEQDYRVLKPRLVTDPNRNRTAVAFDALGMVVGTAVMGKADEHLGDSLAGFAADLSETEILDHLADPHGDPHAILGNATTRLLYDLFAYRRTREQPEPHPAVVYTLARETHAADLEVGEPTNIQHSFSYSDGFGREIQQKGQAEPGPAPRRDANGKIMLGPDGQPEMTDHDLSPRWVGSGWAIFNNKGDPIREYEPFFSDTHRFEFDLRIGVSPVLFYDPLERVVATLHPNHTWEKVVFDTWRQESWDVNDTALEADPRTDPDVGDFFRRLAEAEYLPTWHALRIDPAHASDFAARYPDEALRAKESRAAEKTEVHAGTPTVAHFDTLGRPFLTVAHNRFERDDRVVEEQYQTRVELDIEGNQRAVIDAKGRVVMRYRYSIAGPDEEEEKAGANRIHQSSMEAGERWTLNDASGKPIRSWNSRGQSFRTEYDVLRRQVRVFVTGANPDDPGEEILSERLVYGEQHPQAAAHNLRGKRFLQLDQAGVVEEERYDFKENPLSSSRRLAKEYKRSLDWKTVDAALPGDPTVEIDAGDLEAALAPLLEDGARFTGATDYDALDRPLAITTPDGSVYRPSFNEANLLEQVDVNLRGAAAATRFVANIDYDAKGRRERIEYGNGVVTSYEYDPLTFRLVHLQTVRGAERLQDLFYTHDPAGNISAIRDDAQQAIYFNGTVAEPHADYTYDARYRLMKATGREHIGQADQPTPSSWDDRFRVGLAHPHDGQKIRPYDERYEYDAVGNILRMIHQAANGNWTRVYAYDEPSLLEPDKPSNRLSGTTVGDVTENYAHDTHGNITRMPHLPLMQWDFRDQLQASAQQVINNGGTPETTYYVYDAGGKRVRKITERQARSGEAPRRKEERIYLGGFEIYRAYDGNGSAVKLERETLHVLDDQQRLALVETRTRGSDPAPEQITRYQIGNHLGSASLELDGEARIISYEEYYPYGSTSYQAVRSRTETPKRYRYTGKERDEESGLNYHGARYYAPWLGRWTSVDPLLLEGDPNSYAYGLNNPITFFDPKGTESKRNDDLLDLQRMAELHTRNLRLEEAKQTAEDHLERLEEMEEEHLEKTREEIEEQEPYLRNKLPIERREGERLSREERWSLYQQHVGKGEEIYQFSRQRFNRMKEWNEYLRYGEFMQYLTDNPEFSELYEEHAERYSPQDDRSMSRVMNVRAIGAHGGAAGTAQYRRQRNAANLSRRHAEAFAMPIQTVLTSQIKAISTPLKLIGAWETGVTAGEAGTGRRSGLRVSDILAGETTTVAGEPIEAEEQVIRVVDRAGFVAETYLGETGRKLSEIILGISWKATKEGL